MGGGLQPARPRTTRGDAVHGGRAGAAVGGTSAGPDPERRPALRPGPAAARAESDAESDTGAVVAGTYADAFRATGTRANADAVTHTNAAAHPDALRAVAATTRVLR